MSLKKEKELCSKKRTVIKMLIKDNVVTSDYVKLYDWSGVKFSIPIFQRFYAWKEKEVARLKEDLLKVASDKDAQLYLLDFIYYEEEGFVKLADGQQRIVTLNNLIKAIHDVAEEQKLTISDISLFNISYDVHTNNEKYSTHFTNYPTAPFKKVYLNLYEFVKANASIINDLIDVIKNNIYVYMKKCSNADDAFNIFQQINTGGKPLSKDEVIKTALDQYSLAYGIKFDTSKMKQVRQSLISFYKLKMEDFDKNFDNMEIITFMRRFITKNKDSYQDFVDTINSLESIENSPFKYLISYINRNTLFDVMNIMAMKKIDIVKNNDYLTMVLIPLCMMSVVLTLNGGSPTTFRYLLKEVIEKIKSKADAKSINEFLINTVNEDSITWNISFDNFCEKLGDITTPRNLKKALLILDVVCRNISGTINVDAINLEHVYPKNPDFKWALNGWPSHREEQKKLIDNIGNYLLLCEEVNKKIQNKYIDEKIPYYKSIIEKDIILQTPTNTMEFAKFESNQDKYIEERQRTISSLLYNGLPMAKVLIKK